MAKEKTPKKQKPVKAQEPKPSEYTLEHRAQKSERRGRPSKVALLLEKSSGYVAPLKANKNVHINDVLETGVGGKFTDPVLARKLSSGAFVTWQDRIAIAEIYKRSGFNLKGTAEALGIDSDAVENYFNQVQRVAIEEVKQEKLAYQVAARRATLLALEVKESEFIDKAAQIKMKAAKKIEELLPECENIRDLVAVVKVMHEVSSGRVIAENDIKDLEGKPKSVLMQVALTQINNINFEKREKTEENGTE